MLTIDRLSRSFGGVAALDVLDLTVADGEVVGLIGPNGSGKTTLFNVITGVHAADSGRVLLRGEDITGTTRRPASSAAASREPSRTCASSSA